MQKLIVLKKQLNNCEWEIAVSSYNKEVIEKAKNKLRNQGIKFKTTIYKEITNKHPYKVKFQSLGLDQCLITISINIINCLENEKDTNEEIIIRKTKNSFTVYLWETCENEALFKAEEYYRLHKEHILRQSVQKVSNN